MEPDAQPQGTHATPKPPVPDRTRRRFLAQTFGLSAALGVAAVLNVVYITLLARHLDKTSLGVFFCAHSILLVIAAPGMAVQTYITGLHAPLKGLEGASLFRHWGRTLGVVGFVLAALFAVFSPLLSGLLRFPSHWPVVATGIGAGTYALLPLLYGRLQGRQQFGRLGMAYIVEAGTRPLVAVALIMISMLHATTAVVSLASGYLAASALALALGATARGVPAPAEPSRGSETRPGGLWPTVIALLALSVFAYLDVLFAQYYLGASPEGPGSLFGGSGAYGAAAFVGRAFLMVTLPLVMVMYPKVRLAHGRRQPAWPFLRDAAIMALMVWAVGCAGCATFPAEIAALFFPNLPETADLIRFFPLAILPYMFLILITYYHLAHRRWWVAWVLFGGVILQWAGYASFHATTMEILGVLGTTGGATAVGLSIATVVMERRRA